MPLEQADRAAHDATDLGTGQGFPQLPEALSTT